MIIILWLILSFMVLCICALFFFIFRARNNNVDLTQQETNKHWYQDKLNEITVQHNDGILSSEQYEHEKLLLQKDFSNMITPENTLNLSRHSALSMIVIVFLIVASFLLYQKLGASKELTRFYQQKALDNKAQAAAKKIGSPRQVIEQLKARMLERPNDPQGWYLLGRLYFSQNQFNQAVEAFHHAQVLAPKRADVAIQLAEASYLSANKNDQALAKSRLQAALQLAPEDPAALNLEAVMAYHQKNYQKALSIWQQLALQAPSDGQAAQALRQAIQDVEQKMQQQGNAINQVSLPIVVQVDQVLSQKIMPNDTLFVYAKAVNGPPMPVAIKRLPLTSLPFKTELTNNDGVMPTLKLSDVKQVIVYARISQSGQAMPQSGDLEGRSQIISTKHAPEKIVVTIDSIHKE